MTLLLRQACSATRPSRLGSGVMDMTPHDLSLTAGLFCHQAQSQLMDMTSRDPSLTSGLFCHRCTYGCRYSSINSSSRGCSRPGQSQREGAGGESGGKEGYVSNLPCRNPHCSGCGKEPAFMLTPDASQSYPCNWSQPEIPTLMLAPPYPDQSYPCHWSQPESHSTSCTHERSSGTCIKAVTSLRS